MSEKGNLLKFTIFGNRPKFGDLQLYPLAAARVALLQEKRNPLFIEGLKEGDELGPYPIQELLFVASKTGEELAFVPDDEWEQYVKAFGYDLEDEVLIEAWEYFEKETAAMNAAQAKPKKKKRARKVSRKKT